MKRALEKYILDDLKEKIVILMGPRQCGKTTLSTQLTQSYDYLNFDAINDRKMIQDQSWDRKKPLIIFDELHKKIGWKGWIKGVYDTEGIPPALLITGSAQLNAFKNAGDSLAGRHFHYRLHPLDLKELSQFTKDSPMTLFTTLWECSGFPEPYLKGSPTYYKRWKTSHLDMILRQDLIDLYTIHDLKLIENLVMLLKHRVGSTVSYANLARDLGKDPTTIKRWLTILEELYVIYRVTPYSTKISRSIIKEPKFYFYDHNNVENGDGAKLENIVSNALIKEIDFLHDTQGEKLSLHFLRTKDGKELDFLICNNKEPTRLLEVKKSDDTPSAAFRHFQNFLPNIPCIQLVRDLKREKTYPDGCEVRSLITWLTNLSLS